MYKLAKRLIYSNLNAAATVAVSYVAQLLMQNTRKKWLYYCTQHRDSLNHDPVLSVVVVVLQFLINNAAEIPGRNSDRHLFLNRAATITSLRPLRSACI